MRDNEGCVKRPNNVALCPNENKPATPNTVDEIQKSRENRKRPDTRMCSFSFDYLKCSKFGKKKQKQKQRNKTHYAIGVAYALFCSNNVELFLRN